MEPTLEITASAGEVIGNWLLVVGSRFACRTVLPRLEKTVWNTQKGGCVVRATPFPVVC